MNIQEIKDKNVWERFFEQSKEKTFLQSWNWGEFQKAMGSKIWRLGIYDNNNLISTSLMIKIKAKRGNFLFVPHGPAMKHQALETLLNELKKIAKEERADFIRIAPISERNDKNIKLFRNLGFRNAPIHMHPELSWELDISFSEDELLMGMRKTTRYLIKQGLKNKDIKIIQSKELKDIEIFNEINKQTVKRHHFIPFSLEFLKKQFSAFRSDNQISIFLAKYQGEIIASGIFIFWQNIGFYHHGASSLKHPKIPVSYLLQWEAIKEAKKRNCKLFNFWGIISEKEKSHPWAGLSLFKKGFGGYEKSYVKTQDFPISKKYWLIFVFEKLRKMKRRL